MSGDPKHSTVPQPKTVGPVGVNTSFGTANYNKKTNAYNMSSNSDQQGQQNLNYAQTGLGNALQQLQNPSAAIQQQMDVYRNLEQPTFQRQQQQQLAAATAGLGHQYQSTFGQLTANQNANQAALASAGLEADIYNQGQNRYQQMLQNAATQSGLVDSTQGQYYAPYQQMGNLISQTQPGVSNVNSTNSQNYGTAQQAQTAANQQALDRQKMYIDAGTKLLTTPFIPIP